MATTSPIPMDSLTLPSGRTLAWLVYGGSLDLASSNPPTIVLYFHGLPGSRVEGRFFPEPILRKHHVRLVAIERPGMGGSTYDASRRVLDWPADVLAVADHLQIDQFYTIGASGGGPYAMACAREIPPVQADGTGRLLGTAAICAIYPTSLGTKGMMPSLRAMLWMSGWLPLRMTKFLFDKWIGSAARHPDPAVLERQLDKVFAVRQQLEREILAKEEIHSLVVDSARESFRQSDMGNALEMALVNDWGFDLSELSGAGVTIWHGKDDINVPFQMAEKAAKLMPEAKTIFLEGETHMSVAVNHAEKIIESFVQN